VEFKEGVMRKNEIIQQLEQAWGTIPGWMKEWSSTSLEGYLLRLGWVVGSNGLSIHADPEKMAIAEGLLSDSLGRDIQLAPVEIAGPGTGRAHILRMRTTVDDPSIPSSFIVKLVNEDYPWASGKADLFRTFFNEWATYEFFRQLKLPELITPQFYGGDSEAGVLVIEDFGKVGSVYDAVFGADASYAEELLIGWMETIGNMHALTVGHQDMFDRIRSALGPIPSDEIKNDKSRRMVDNFRRTCELVGVKLRRGCVKEIKDITAMTANPGALAVLSKGDNTPGDCVQVGSKLKLLDFEFGRFQHALLDATVLRMIYPTAWRGEYLTPGDVVVQAEGAYRKELMKGCPQAEDDVLFARAFVGAAAYWCLDQDGQLSPKFVSGLLEEDNSWRGRQRVVQRLTVLARTSEEFGQLPAIGATARDLASRLCGLWPELEMMAYYPAFAHMENST
jgi:hypothetical protein